jgi:hypothetical protein
MAPSNINCRNSVSKPTNGRSEPVHQHHNFNNNNIEYNTSTTTQRVLMLFVQQLSRRQAKRELKALQSVGITKVVQVIAHQLIDGASAQRLLADLQSHDRIFLLQQQSVAMQHVAHQYTAVVMYRELISRCTYIDHALKIEAERRVAKVDSSFLTEAVQPNGGIECTLDSCERNTCSTTNDPSVTASE